MQLVRLLRGALLGAALSAFSLLPAVAQERLAIKGYDPVAYFTEGKPVPGSAAHEAVWGDAKWRFASGEHRALFVKEPGKYVPQYRGFCAMGVAYGMKVEVDPEAWTIVDGKLYLNYDKASREKWQADRTAMIKTADEKWEQLGAPN